MHGNIFSHKSAHSYLLLDKVIIKFNMMSIKHRIYKHVYNIDTVLPNIVLTILSFNLSVVIFGKGEVSSF